MKLNDYNIIIAQGQSPPSRRRGLKSIEYAYVITVIVVASFAEAWIEISHNHEFMQSHRVASFAEAWIEIVWDNSWIWARACRLLRGGVD